MERLARLKSGGIEARTPDCPPDPVWIELAAGLRPAESEQYIDHASQCDHCGTLLRLSVEDFTASTTTDEDLFLSSLSSSNPTWQAVLAQKLVQKEPQQRPSNEKAIAQLGGLNEKFEPPAESSRPGSTSTSTSPWPKWFFYRPKLILAAATLIVLAIAGWLTMPLLHPSAQRLLAQAYTERRTMEMRIPGAQYAPLRVERGDARSNLDKPESLLRAEALIGQKLVQHPNDPTWLQYKARADLLDGNYEAAIKSLNRALDTYPNSPSLLTDMGSALFLQAEGTNSDGNATQWFSQALTLSPHDPVALYNRAIASEKTHLYLQAVDDWKNYLVVDSKSSWANEARERLAQIQRKLQRKQLSAVKPLLGPASLVDVLTSRQSEGEIEIDQRIEQYLENAIIDWLPDAFPGTHRNSNPQVKEDSQRALVLLADILVRRHHDRWLADLLQLPHSNSFAIGSRYLSSAVQANAEGDPDTALFLARSAHHWFGRAKSRPGELRAQLEEVYALHRQYHGEQCLGTIASLKTSLRTEAYPWIQIQTALEQYACLGPKEIRYKAVSQLLSNARALSGQSGYGTTYLRAVAFTASSETDAGSAERASDWDRAGLDKYWSGEYPPVRAQHFYDDLSISAQDSENWLLAVALGREAVLAIAASQNRTGEGLERIRLADSDFQAGFWDDAKQQYSKALVAFSSLPLDHSNRAFRASAEIGLAQVALNQGRVHDAESHLQYVRDNLPPNFDEPHTWLSLYKVLAELRLQKGDPGGARKACLASIQMAELELLIVHTELGKLRWKRDGSEDCYKSLVESEIKKGDDASALEYWEWFQSAGARVPQPQFLPFKHFSDLDQAPSAPVIYEVRSRLRSLATETVIDYADLDDGITAWVYDDRGIYRQHLEVSHRTLNRVIKKLAIECADPESDLTALQADSRQLYDFLIGPLIPRLTPRRALVIETGDELSAVPFAALIAPTGRYLIDNFSVTYLPSVAFRDILRRAVPISRGNHALVVGEPALAKANGSSYAALPDARSEAQEISSNFDHVLLLSGQHATAAALSNALLEVSIFHFAGHNGSRSTQNGLMMAPESGSDDTRSGLFGPAQIAATRMPHLRLAVLSACSTGDTSDSAAAANSLARSFLLNGVSDVVATRWSVDSVATATFMHFFYQHVLEGDKVPAAVAISMNQLRTIPGYSHPYFWASFNAYGSGADSKGNVDSSRYAAPIKLEGK
jgi:CHAT domain-containing protein/tetratricopeptide (TPR) repeat protein